jgi:hypothetical protein
VNPDAPGQGCGSASTGPEAALAEAWVLAEVLLVTPVHADTAANTVATVTAGSQNLSLM